MLIYIICFLLIALPLFIIEFSLGRASRSSITTGFKSLAPRKPWFVGGWVGILANILVFSYYTMVIGWVIAYLFKTVRRQYFGMSAPQIDQLFDGFTGDSIQVFSWQILVYIILGIIVSRGLVRGVESFSKVAMPLLFLMILGLGAYAFTLPGALKGFEFYLKPDFTKLSTEAVLVAMGQVFLSIGVGFGTTWVYGSYLSKRADIPSDALKIGVMDTTTALLAGLIIFPSAFAFGINPGSGYNLIFVTLPNVFARMQGGAVFGLCFFFLVTIAALTSAIAHAECISSWLMDELNWNRDKKRKRAIWITISGCFVVGMPSALSLGPWKEVRLIGLSIFSFIDHVSVDILLVLAGLIMALFVGWSMGISKFAHTANLGAKRFLIRPYWKILVKYLIPIIISALFLEKIL